MKRLFLFLGAFVALFGATLPAQSYVLQLSKLGIRAELRVAADTVKDIPQTDLPPASDSSTRATSPTAPFFTPASPSDSDHVAVERSSTPIPDLPWYGSLAWVESDTLLDITKADRRAIQYHTMGEVFIRGTMFQPLSQGGFGQHDAVSIAGGTNRNQGITFNGRPMASSYSGQYLLSTVAPEGMDRAEVLTGSSALGLSATLTQTAINFMEVRYQTPTPYTALWYSQGGGETVAADAVFAQNVAPGLNLNAGVRRIGADGRYSRTRFDSWNARLGLRWAVDSSTTLGIAYHLTSHNTDQWGGVRTVIDLDELTERTAPPVFDDVRDHTRRHDVTLGFEHLLTSDSLHAVTATLYYTLDGMMRIRDTTLIPYTADTSKHVHYMGHTGGFVVRSRHQLGTLLIRPGIALDYTSNQEAAYTLQAELLQPHAFVLANMMLSSSLGVQVGAHATYANRSILGGIGGGMYAVSGFTKFKADVSIADRAPTNNERIELKPERTFLALLEGRYDASDLSIIGQLFYRSTSNAITADAVRDSNQRVLYVTSYNALDDHRLFGIAASAQYRHQWFEIAPTVRLHAIDVRQSPLPPFSADVSAAFVYRAGGNSVRIGGKASVTAPMASQQFVPTAWQFVQPIVADQGWVGNGLDAFLHATLGNASIRLSYENILAERWYTTALNPMIIRDLRLSVTWSFLD